MQKHPVLKQSLMSGNLIVGGNCVVGGMEGGGGVLVRDECNIELGKWKMRICDV